MAESFGEYVEHTRRRFRVPSVASLQPSSLAGGRDDYWVGDVHFVPHHSPLGMQLNAALCAPRPDLEALLGEGSRHPSADREYHNIRRDFPKAVWRTRLGLQLAALVEDGDVPDDEPLIGEFLNMELDETQRRAVFVRILCTYHLDLTAHFEARTKMDRRLLRLIQSGDVDVWHPWVQQFLASDPEKKQERKALFHAIMRHQFPQDYDALMERVDLECQGTLYPTNFPFEDQNALRSYMFPDYGLGRQLLQVLEAGDVDPNSSLLDEYYSMDASDERRREIIWELNPEMARQKLDDSHEGRRMIHLLEAGLVPFDDVLVAEFYQPGADKPRRLEILKELTRIHMPDVYENVYSSGVGALTPDRGHSSHLWTMPLEDEVAFRHAIDASCEGDTLDLLAFHFGEALFEEASARGFYEVGTSAQARCIILSDLFEESAPDLFATLEQREQMDPSSGFPYLLQNALRNKPSSQL